MTGTPRAPRPLSSRAALTLLLLATTLFAVYFLARYRGLWGDGDTFALGNATAAVLADGRLVPAGPAYVYPNGFGYQTIIAFLGQVSGVGLPALQVYGAALLALWLVVPAWLLYRELTDSPAAATLATVLLLVQPEFLFAVFRGSHEKYSRGLMLLGLYLLARSLRRVRRPRDLAPIVLAFYLTGYALITLNNYLSSSFILGMALSFAFLLVARPLFGAATDTIGPTLRRLSYVLAVLFLLVFLFTFYLYAPALQVVSLLQSVGTQLLLLLLDVEATATAEPFQAVTAGWVSLPIYLLVSLANWVLLAVSALIWLLITWRWWRRPDPDRPLHELLLWAFYGAFAFQGAVSILVDVSGAIAGNLQHRTFPTFAMLAAPLVGWWFIGTRRSRPGGRLVRPLAAVAIGLLAVLSALKATNEPLVSNKWTFFVPAEQYALTWADEALAGRLLWTGYDERLVAGPGIRRLGGPPWHVRQDIYAVDPATADFLISDVNRQRGRRLGQPLPVTGDALIIYDNGPAQILHRRPQTPFQR